MTAPLSHARVLRIAVPIVLANASVPLLGLVDTGVIGQLGQAAPIGAVGLGAVVLSALYWVFGFLRMGTAGMTAQAIGAGDTREVAALLARALIFAAGAGIVVIALQSGIAAAAFALAPASPEVESLARTYMGIRVWSAPAAIALFGISGWLIAQERTRALMLLQIGMNGINVLLDFWFVPGLGWGVAGVASATVIAEWGGLLAGLWLCRTTLASPAMRAWGAIFDRVRLLKMVAVNRDILIRTLLLESIFLSFMFLGAGFGDVTLAANQVLLQFLQVTAFALDGFAFAAEALVGQAMGARARSTLRQSARLTGIWGAGLAILLSLGFALAGPATIDVLTTAPDVRMMARSFLPWLVAVPILGVAAWMFDGIFVGATRTSDMRNTVAASAVIYAIAALTLAPVFGNHGLWAALCISFVARGIALGLRYPALERAAEA
ncbi:MATE family efflux transporter [Pseudoruegeria sp. SK021]|uniref:MATE family efflux transporter n=1 Tax=Pseudoruegeria sp. SK021 TaxID=1933035 RepID=UPI000A228CD2|nr:MATE family efflux transporter [Pseudoruegeria sp. SK021]OSP56393.1 MATE family efflux transporter [Pseudoruegeria sp. SK021]